MVRLIVYGKLVEIEGGNVKCHVDSRISNIISLAARSFPAFGAIPEEWHLAETALRFMGGRVIEFDTYEVPEGAEA